MSTDTPPTTTPRKAPASKKAPATAKGPGRPSNRDRLADDLAAQLAGIGAVVAAFHEADGLSIVNHSPRIGAALADLAEKNPKVKKALTASVETSAWGGVIVAIAPLALELIAHHTGPRPEPTPEASTDGTQPFTFPGVDVPAPPGPVQL